MTTGQKVLLVLGCVAGLILLAAGSAWFLWRKYGAQMVRQGQAAMVEGRGLGRTVTAQQCLDSVLTRHASTEVGFGNTVVQSLFFKGCLETGSDLAALCAQTSGTGVFAGANWQRSICRARHLGDQYCPTVVQPLTETCRRRALPGGGS